MSEQPFTRGSAGGRRGPAVSPTPFMTSNEKVSPAPWLTDAPKVTVRPLFTTGEEDDSSQDDGALDASSPPSPDVMAPPAPPPPAPPVAPQPPAPPARDPFADAFARAVAEHLTARARALAAVEDQLLELSVQLAEVLVERELEREPELHAALVRTALAALEGHQPTGARASRAAYTAIVGAFGVAEVEVDGVRVPITLDPRLDGVGVVVDGVDTRVDGRVGERLRSALRAMQDERRRREAEVAT